MAGIDGKDLEELRLAAGLTQDALAQRIGSSRPTVSAYENNRKSPTLTTLDKILVATRTSLFWESEIHFTEISTGKERPFFVPNQLWRLRIEDAYRTVELPIEVNWSRPQLTFDLCARQQRQRCYEIVLREGMPQHIVEFIDGALLVDLWDELVLPRLLRNTWQNLIEKALPCNNPTRD